MLILISQWVSAHAYTLASLSPIWKPTWPPWRKSNSQLRRWLQAYVHQSMKPLMRFLVIKYIGYTCVQPCLGSSIEPLIIEIRSRSILGWQLPWIPWPRRWKRALHSLGHSSLSWSWIIRMVLCPVKGWLRCFSASSSLQKLWSHCLLVSDVVSLKSKMFEWWKSTHSHACTLGLRKATLGGCVWPMGPSRASFLVGYSRCQWWWCGRTATRTSDMQAQHVWVYLYNSNFAASWLLWSGL